MSNIVHTDPKPPGHVLSDQLITQNRIFQNYRPEPGQFLAGTGPEPDLKKMTGSTGTGFPVTHCVLSYH